MFSQGFLHIHLPPPTVLRNGAACVLLPDLRILVAGDPDSAVSALNIWT